MPELIYKQAVLEIAMCYCPDDDGSCSMAGYDIREMLDEIEALPTIEPEVRHGRWNRVRTAGVISVWKCSECDSTITENSSSTNPANHYKFCYNCGAKMDEGAEQ
jgi:hypothetical protein